MDNNEIIIYQPTKAEYEAREAQRIANGELTYNDAKYALYTEMVKQMREHLKISQAEYIEASKWGYMDKMNLAIEIGCEEYTCYPEFDFKPENMSYHASAAIAEFKIKSKTRHIAKKLGR